MLRSTNDIDFFCASFMIPTSQFLQRRLPITILVLPGFSSEKPSLLVISTVLFWPIIVWCAQCASHWYLVKCLRHEGGTPDSALRHSKKRRVAANLQPLPTCKIYTWFIGTYASRFVRWSPSKVWCYSRQKLCGALFSSLLWQIQWQKLCEMTSSIPKFNFRCAGPDSINQV